MKRWGVIAAVLGTLLMAAPASADVPPGFDLFEADPEQTAFNFREEFSIPPGFFDQGSEPFSGSVNFGGPSVTDPQFPAGGDLLIRRFFAADTGPPFPGNDIVPVRIERMSLESIRPLLIQVNGQTQVWDVRAGLSPTRESQGLFRILQQSSAGGLFDAQVEVVPQFTFTRRSDGDRRILNWGSIFDEGERDLFAGSNANPWRAGCVPPALADDDPFCPGLTVNPHRRLVSLVGGGVSLGLRPAAPRLEHFACYEMRRRKSRRRTVRLRNQFGTVRGLRVLNAIGLCAPARKRNEPYENTRAHLYCRELRKRFFRSRRVDVRNQFGRLRLRLLRRTMLCLPSTKRRGNRRPRRLGASDRIDHFTCYSLRRRKIRRRTIVIRDQFGRAKIRLLRPDQLCAPTSKNGGRLDYPVQHLLCYRITRRKVRRRKVTVRNQFGTERRVITVRSGFCVPTLKLPG